MKKVFAAFIFAFAMMVSLPTQAQSIIVPLTVDDYAWDGYGMYRTGYVVNCNEWISLREYPSTEAPRLAEIPLGAQVTVYNRFYRSGEPGIYNLFYKVTYRGIEGYALYHYIRLAD